MSIMIQARQPGTTHWLTVTAAYRGAFERCGFEIRELRA